MLVRLASWLVAYVAFLLLKALVSSSASSTVASLMVIAVTVAIVTVAYAIVAIATVATAIMAVAIVASFTLVVSSAAILTALFFVCTVSPMLIVDLFIVSLVVFLVELCVKLC
jgi:hypothetical protein